MISRPMANGFSFVELLVAVTIILVVTGAMLALTRPAHAMFEAEPERADMQQRIRIAVETISKDLRMAGAGGQLTGGAIIPGRLFATVVPRRLGMRSPDSAESFFDDRVSIMYVPPAAAETILSAATGSTGVIPVRPQPGCPGTDPLCGFRANQLVAVYDGTGVYDTFRISAVQDNPPMLVGAGSPLSKVYTEGATVAEIVAATYWLQRDTHQLMRYDGWQTDAPVADHISALKFEYFGDGSPPILRRPLSDPQGPWTSYGPTPPLVDLDDISTPGYGAGENCVFTVERGATITRPDVPDLGGGPSLLVRLDAQRLVDGPWCPDPGSALRFDADLLRIRRVRVTVRVRASRTLLTTRIPDLEISVDVAPRNLGL